MKYTAEEVRAIAKRLHDDITVADGDALMASDMLTNYAERIEAAQSEDWRIAFFERWHEAAQEKGYVGIAAAITAVPAAELVAQDDWRIGFFERWREAAHEKGYAGIAEAITAAPIAPSPGEDVVLAAIAANPDDVADQFDEPATHDEVCKICGKDTPHHHLRGTKPTPASPINLAAVREVIAYLRSFRSNTPPTWAHLDDAADKLETAIKGIG